MCLAVYLATARPLPDSDRAPLNVEAAAPETAERLRRHLALPHLYYVASHEGCGCGFVAERDGTDEELGERQASLGALRDLLAEAARAGGAELLACADGSEATPPRRSLTLDDPDDLRLREEESALFRVAAAG